MKNIDYLSENIRWEETFDAEYPFRAFYEGDELLLRLNNFPAESLYTLLVNGDAIADFDDFSDNWTVANESSASHSFEISNHAA